MWIIKVILKRNLSVITMFYVIIIIFISLYFCIQISAISMILSWVANNYKCLSYKGKCQNCAVANARALTDAVKVN